MFILIWDTKTAFVVEKVRNAGVVILKAILKNRNRTKILCIVLVLLHKPAKITSGLYKCKKTVKINKNKLLICVWQTIKFKLIVGITCTKTSKPKRVTILEYTK